MWTNTLYFILCYSTGSYHDARKKLSLAEITNEIPPSDPGKEKKQKKPCVPYSPDDETSDEEPTQPPKWPSSSSHQHTKRIVGVGSNSSNRKNRVKLELQMAFIPTPKVNHEEAQRWSYVSIPWRVCWSN